jgi:hypothetical protein
MGLRPGPNGFVGGDDWVGEWEDDEHPGEWYHGNMEVSSSPGWLQDRASPIRSPSGYPLPRLSQLFPRVKHQASPHTPASRRRLLAIGAEEQSGGWLQNRKKPSDKSKIKHRRRTSPEQLKVLEHWFEINSKPDNALREWLAGELGMTKRNVQVWFQNR